MTPIDTLPYGEDFPGWTYVWDQREEAWTFTRAADGYSFTTYESKEATVRPCLESAPPLVENPPPFRLHVPSLLEDRLVAPQGREDTPYDRGFADGKKQGVAKVQARLAAAEALAKAVEGTVSYMGSEYEFGDVSKMLSTALAAYRSAP